MSTTSEYLQQLQTDKQTLVDNLVTKGVSATSDETFTELVPKVLDISTGTDIEITDASYLFYGNARLDYLEEFLSLCKNVTHCNYMFASCSDLTNFNLNNFDFSQVTQMMEMFSGCSNLESINIQNFNTQKVTNFSRMFVNDNKLTSVYFDNINTSSATNISYMFAYTGLISIDLSDFDTNKVTNSMYMFQNCTNLTKVIINRQDVFKMTSTSMLSNTPIADGTGYVYVPDNMVETYKSATNWSTYADQIKGMSELEEA